MRHRTHNTSAVFIASVISVCRDLCCDVLSYTNYHYIKFYSTDHLWFLIISPVIYQFMLPSDVTLFYSRVAIIRPVSDGKENNASFRSFTY